MPKAVIKAVISRFHPDGVSLGDKDTSIIVSDKDGFIDVEIEGKTMADLFVALDANLRKPYDAKKLAIVILNCPEGALPKGLKEKLKKDHEDKEIKFYTIDSEKYPKKAMHEKLSTSKALKTESAAAVEEQATAAAAEPSRVQRKSCALGIDNEAHIRDQRNVKIIIPQSDATGKDVTLLIVAADDRATDFMAGCFVLDHDHPEQLTDLAKKFKAKLPNTISSTNLIFRKELPATGVCSYSKHDGNVLNKYKTCEFPNPWTLDAEGNLRTEVTIENIIAICAKNDYINLDPAPGASVEQPEEAIQRGLRLLAEQRNKSTRSEK